MLADRNRSRRIQCVVRSRHGELELVSPDRRIASACGQDRVEGHRSAIRDDVVDP